MCCMLGGQLLIEAKILISHAFKGNRFIAQQGQG